METIYALASARGRAGVSVIRISGADAFDAVRRLGVERLPPVRQAGLRRLTHAGDVLDDALVLLFAKGASFTGEETAELHVHGSTATVAAVLSALGACGLRLAEPGEFTRRALENGCLDLTQVEGLADLIDAETESQRKQALKVLSGAIGQRAESWRRALIRAAALIEATIDFADEDVPVDVSPEVEALLQDVLSDLRNEVGGSVAAERIREGFEVAIVGAPNAGKSTLLNYLAGREAAITSDIAGTTRDVIEVRMDVQGLAVTFLDTAGLRDTDDRIEAMGIARAMERAKAADLRIFLDDGTPQLLDPQPDDVIVRSKADISGIGVSGVTGAGVKELIANVSDVLSRRSGSAGTITRARHREAIKAAIQSLEGALNLLHCDLGDELVAESLRSAIRCLDALVGRVDVEDLLSEIFASFCIGK